MTGYSISAVDHGQLSKRDEQRLAYNQRVAAFRADEYPMLRGERPFLSARPSAELTKPNQGQSISTMPALPSMPSHLLTNFQRR